MKIYISEKSEALRAAPSSIRQYASAQFFVGLGQAETASESQCVP